MGAIVEAVGSPEFLAGLRWGGITAAVGLAVGLGWRRRLKKPAPVAGLAAVVAAALAMSITGPLPSMVWAGLGLLALAGAIFPWTRRIPFLPLLVAFPGAWLIGRSGLPGPDWVVSVVSVVVAVVGPVAAWFDEDADGSPTPAWLFAIAAAGVWVTVPDTEEALVLLGAIAAATLLSWPLGVARLGSVGVHALVGLYMWVVAWGGRGREGAVVGAVAALGMLFAAPVAAWMARNRNVATTGWAAVWLVVLQILVVAVSTRVGGLRPDPFDAAAIAVPALLAALLLWLLTERSISHAPRSDQTE
ncbi:MAG: hypothetical protein ACRDWH_10455 [Acidimicrobiia bacterium]